MNKLHIVLHEPEIPQNTGNIARSCAALQAELHLIEPLGFSIDEKQVRRAGLDYWSLLSVHSYKNWQTFLDSLPESASLFFLSTKAHKRYDKASYSGDCYLVFGKESAGIPETILKEHWEETIRIPMDPKARSLNLSNAVAIVAYEVERQWNFESLKTHGPGLRMDT